MNHTVSHLLEALVTNAKPVLINYTNLRRILQTYLIGEPGTATPGSYLGHDHNSPRPRHRQPLKIDAIDWDKF